MFQLLHFFAIGERQCNCREKLHTPITHLLDLPPRVALSHRSFELAVCGACTLCLCVHVCVCAETPHRQGRLTQLCKNCVRISCCLAVGEPSALYFLRFWLSGFLFSWRCLFELSFFCTYFALLEGCKFANWLLRWRVIFRTTHSYKWRPAPIKVWEFMQCCCCLASSEVVVVEVRVRKIPLHLIWKLLTICEAWKLSNSVGIF